MKKSIFGFILAILLICPFMSQVLRAEARDTDSKVTDADKISYYSFDNISGGLIADEWGSRNAVISGGKIFRCCDQFLQSEIRCTCRNRKR